MPVCLQPFPRRAGWGVSSGDGCCEQFIMEVSAGQYRSKSPKDVVRRDLLTKRVYSEQGEWDSMELVVWAYLMTLRTVYKSVS